MHTGGAALYPTLSAQSDWARRLDDAEFSLELWSGWVHVYRTLPMKDVLAHGTSLSDQAEPLGQWAEKAIADLGDIDPGVVDLPGAKPKRA